MKKILFSLVLAGLFLVGCQDANLNPVSSDENKPAINKTDVSGLQVDNILQNTSNPTLNVQEQIDGQRGGIINIDKEVVQNNRKVRVKVSLGFGRGSFNSTQNISVMVNPVDASITFLPHVRAFNNIVKLDVTIEGIDLTKLNLNKSRKVNFVYFNDDGKVSEIIKSIIVKVDYKTGTLSVRGAELKHFSRYGWAT